MLKWSDSLNLFLEILRWIELWLSIYKIFEMVVEIVIFIIIVN